MSKPPQHRSLWHSQPSLLLAWSAAWVLGNAEAQPLAEAPTGFVSSEILQQKEAELKKARADLQSAEVRLKQATAKPAADPAVNARQIQLLADLIEARKRIDQLEAQLRDVERQRDDARATAQRAQAATRSTADPDPALRAERDRLKRELVRSTEEKDRLQAELAQVQRALQAAKDSAPGTTGKKVFSNDYRYTSPYTEPVGLVDGQELTVPGCGAACPSFIVLPHVGRVTMGTGSRARTVDFKRRLAMGKTEVTVVQWKHFMSDSGYRSDQVFISDCGWDIQTISDQHPVRCISAEDADAYAEWFHKKFATQLHTAMKQVSLPTEEEWEYAARAGRWTQDQQWDQDHQNCKLANSAECTGSNAPDPVARKGRLPNAWGLYDTISNVWEWTSSSGAKDSLRAMRGGAFRAVLPLANWHLSTRIPVAPSMHADYVGFRLIARFGP